MQWGKILARNAKENIWGEVGTIGSQQGLRKKIQADLIFFFFAARIMGVPIRELQRAGRFWNLS